MVQKRLAFKNIIFLGALTVRIKFNRPPEKDVSLLMFAESTSCMEITPGGRLQFSYVPR